MRTGRAREYCLLCRKEDGAGRAADEPVIPVNLITCFGSIIAEVKQSCRHLFTA